MQPLSLAEMASELIDISQFLSLYNPKQLPILDVRSENEFAHAHFPGAINIPLLNNEERIIVGTLYVQQGRSAAVQKGMELVGPRFYKIIEEAKKNISGNEAVIYCWRGGMRSDIVSWLLELSGVKVIKLKGGYKTFRKWALDVLNEKKNIVVIGGKTGSGKTQFLKSLSDAGEQVIDLEALANHKGSAFGSLGQKPQPSTEHFENMLALQWNIIDPGKILWLENESSNIGYVVLPKQVYIQMRNAPVAEIEISYQERKQRILDEYCTFPVEDLIACTHKISKRLGGLRLNEAINLLQERNFSAWVDLMLQYYDKGYELNNKDRKEGTITTFKSEEQDFGLLVEKVVEYYSSGNNYNLALNHEEHKGFSQRAQRIRAAFL